MSTLQTTNIKHPSSASNNIVLDSSGGVDLDALTISGSAPADSVNIDASGRLLVGTSTARSNFYAGTTTPGVQLPQDVSILRPFNDQFSCNLILAKSRGTGNVVVNSGDNVGTITFQGNDGTNFISAGEIRLDVDGTPGANDMPGRLVFSTTADGASSPTERMRINQKGEAKFSTTGSYPSATTGGHQFRTAENLPTLTVNNAIASGFADTVAQITLGYAANTTTNHFLYCNDTSAARMYVRSNGGIGNYQSNDVNLSDRNLKKDISPATTTWDCIKQWEIVNYRYKDQPDKADLNLGVIAQQVAESCPEVVTIFQEAKEATEDKPAQEECLGVKEQQMMWMAIKALQEAQVRIETLEAEVAALKAS